jgi:phage head maturation protease
MGDERMETKSIAGFEIKDADRGEVTAIVSTFNVVDRDGDVILPGAIKDGATVKLSGYGHDVVMQGMPPAGIGTVSVDQHRAVFTGKYFMDTQRGRDAFAVVKGLGSESEWSIGFPREVKTAKMTDEWRTKGARRLIAGLEILEASPVFVGANALTGTLGVKSEDQADGAAAAAIDAATLAEAVVLIQTKQAAEAAETKRLAEDAATKAAEEAEQARLTAESQERARIAEIATKEYERFQRTMRRYA